MQTLAQLYLPLLRKLERPKVDLPDVRSLGFLRALGDGAELHRRALSAAYLTALFMDRPKEHLPDEDLEGRDPRW